MGNSSFLKLALIKKCFFLLGTPRHKGIQHVGFAALLRTWQFSIAISCAVIRVYRSPGGVLFMQNGNDDEAYLLEPFFFFFNLFKLPK